MYDRGPVEDTAPTSRILLLLSRTTAQRKALDELLAEQQNPSSASFHQWLTPEAFGSQFGAPEADVQKITDWLSSKGFRVEKVAANRTVIELSGTAGQIRDAFLGRSGDRAACVILRDVPWPVSSSFTSGPREIIMGERFRPRVWLLHNKSQHYPKSGLRKDLP